MRKLIFLMALLLGACSHNAQYINISAGDLGSAMAYGKIIELNDISPVIEKDLLVRLYQVPVFGEDCFIETHGVCWNKYYITVSTFDEYPETNVFSLNMLGEVVDTQWLQDDKYDYVKIEFTLNKYTREAVENNKSLMNTQSKVLLKLTPNSVIEAVN